MATIDVILWVHQANKDGTYPLRLRITKNRKTTYKALGYSIEGTHWDKQHKKVKKSHPNSTRLNNLISKRIVEIQGIALDEETKDSFVSIKKIKKKLKGIESSNFFVFAENYLKKYATEKSRNTYRGYKSVLQKLKYYLSSESLLFSEIDYQFLVDYHNHLKGIGNNPNTSAKNLKRIRSIFNEAVRHGLVDRSTDPFYDFKMESNKTYKEKLSIEEINRIRALSYPVNILKWHVKNIFLISFNFMGMRIGDALTLKKIQVSSGRLIYSMRKTDDNVSLQLTKEAHDILGNYNITKLKPNDFIFPLIKPNKKSLHAKISSATALYNKYLRLLAKDASIEKHLSSHVARHSWAQQAKLLNVNIAIIQQVFGHSSSSTTENYMEDFDDKIIDDVNQKIVG
ncbi:MAG: phage integrase SAM-like domain-containing protein [Bacteroidia bacterium]